MARLNGPTTTNLGLPTLGLKDEFDSHMFNEALGNIDTRVNIVADETQALATHEADTTSVHGITNTANLVLTADSRLSDARTPTGAAGGVLSGTYPNPGFASDMATQTELDNHASDTTSVHGITDTTKVVITNDTPANNEVLTYTTANGVVWAAAAAGGSTVACQLTVPTNANITADALNSPANYVQWSTPSIDTNSMYNASYPTRILIPETGLYSFDINNLGIYHDDAATVSMAFYVFTTQSGSTFRTSPYRFGYSSTAFSAARNGPHNLHAKVYCTAGESIALGVACAFASTGTTRTVNGANDPNSQYGTSFTVAKL